MIKKYTPTQHNKIYQKLHRHFATYASGILSMHWHTDEDATCILDDTSV